MHGRDVRLIATAAMLRVTGNRPKAVATTGLQSARSGHFLDNTTTVRSNNENRDQIHKEREDEYMIDLRIEICDKCSLFAKPSV